MDIAYIFLACLVFLMYGITLWMSGQEGFENEGSQTFEDAEEIYNDVYASIYDLLWNPQDMLKYEQVSMQDISLADWNTKNVHVLDMACGTGPHAQFFKQLGVDYTGVDLSESMLKKARENTPSGKFQKGDITQVHLFPQKSMTHCVLTGFSIYQFSNPKLISDNAYQWLQPGGYFVVHLVDPDKYDPIHNLSSPFAAFSLQKYAFERQTESSVFFDKFKYTGKLLKQKDEDDAVYEETLSYYDKEDNGGTKYTVNKHRWNMPSKERLIDIFKTSGFRHVENVDLVRCSKEYQYLCYFTK
jgi:ubiquinone/menaquinone biosynthesis C-methylase UbiE